LGFETERKHPVREGYAGRFQRVTVTNTAEVEVRNGGVSRPCLVVPLHEVGVADVQRRKLKLKANFESRLSSMSFKRSVPGAFHVDLWVQAAPPDRCRTASWGARPAAAWRWPRSTPCRRGNTSHWNHNLEAVYHMLRVLVVPSAGSRESHSSA
jgi:hypothetical protein